MTNHVTFDTHKSIFWHHVFMLKCKQCYLISKRSERKLQCFKNFYTPFEVMKKAVDMLIEGFGGKRGLGILLKSLIKSDSTKIRRQKHLHLFTTNTSIFTLAWYTVKFIFAGHRWLQLSLMVYMTAFYT